MGRCKVKKQRDQVLLRPLLRVPHFSKARLVPDLGIALHYMMRPGVSGVIAGASVNKSLSWVSESYGMRPL